MEIYIKITEKIDKFFLGLNLNHYQIKLLDMAVKAHLSKNMIVVSDLITQNSLASTTTLHRAFKDLQYKNLLTVKRNKKDGRSKGVYLTPEALNHYKKLSEEIIANGKRQ